MLIMDEFKDLKAEREIQIGKTTRCPLGWWLESKRKGYQALVRMPTNGCAPESPVKCGPTVWKPLRQLLKKLNADLAYGLDISFFGI